MGEQTTLKIITQGAAVPGAPAVAGGIPTGGVPTDPKSFQAFQQAFGDSLRDFSQNLTASVTATLSGALVGRATGSFTAAGAVSTIVGQTVRTIQARASREQEFAELSPEEQIISARERVEGRKLSEFEKLIARREVSAKPEIARKEAVAAGLVGESTQAASAAAKILPVMGALLAAGLVAKEAFSRVSEGLENLEESLAPFSGEIAEARASVQIRAIEGRIRRAEEFGPALAGLAETRGRFEESFEDFKARILVTVLPTVEGILNIATFILDKLPFVGPDTTQDQDFVQRVFDQLVSEQPIQQGTRLGVGRGQL